MKRMMHILYMAAMLLAALPAVSCHHPAPEENTGELSVSIYIPDVIATKAETGSVGALESEKVFSTLQLWVFVSGGTYDGRLVGYKGFTSSQLAETGLPHSAVTRFAMPLDQELFTLLSQADTRVDVYALANVASAGDDIPGERTSRSALDEMILSGSTFGTSPLTMAVPAAGLPMSGVIKAAPVTGSYPVLNISTVTLTRTVSKIRFVFCQQASGSDPAVAANPSCMVKSISFGGTEEGHDCQIAAVEKLFTDHKYGNTENPFEIDGYTPLSSVIAGENGAPLMQNGDLSISAHPEELLFRSAGYEMETAREYEARLDAAIGTSSRTAPIYIRETDKRISGTIVYDAGKGEQTATFTMPADDVLSRNHSWILYAYFAEATRTLEFKIVVLPWDKSTYDFDFKDWTVNVIRRFTINEADTFKKIQNSNGYFDIYFWHTLNGQPNVIKGDILIDAPVGQELHVVPVAGATEGHTKVDGIFSVTPMYKVIYPNYQNPENARTEDCRIEFEIGCNPGTHTDEELEGNYLDLHFCVKVKIGDDERWIDLDSESIDYYRIILKKNWDE